MLEGLLSVNYKSKKILGETCNLIMADHIATVDAVSGVLNVLAKFRYTIADSLTKE